MSWTRTIHICGGGGPYKPGDPKPDGYNERAEWNEAMRKAGLKQKRCPICCLWHWHPHEFSDQSITTRPFYIDKKKAQRVYVKQVEPICKECATKRVKESHAP